MNNVMPFPQKQAPEFIRDADGFHAFCCSGKEAKDLAAELNCNAEVAGEMIFVEGKKNTLAGEKRCAELGYTIQDGADEYEEDDDE